jgi:transposase
MRKIKKLTENEILEIIELNKSGKKYKDIAPMYGKSKNYVNKAVNDYRRKVPIVLEA